MSKEQLAYYLDRYETGMITSEEWKTLQEMLHGSSNDAMLDEILDGELAGIDADSVRNPHLIRRLQTAIEVQIASEGRVSSMHRVRFLRKWSWAAASVLLIIASIIVFSNRKSVDADGLAGNIAPGKEGAILTLADGTQVALDSIGNGVVATQNGMQAVLKNGQLAYTPTGENTGKIAYNTVSTPKGRQFKVVLPDGTSVWLNAASSIRYPTVFASNERKVDVTGEVYFEIAKNERSPFRVNVNNKAGIEVLGTDFNVNAYDNEESISTTLITGSVKVQAGAVHPVILKPGQQAQLFAAQPGLKLVEDPDIEKVIAWKNGAFNFEGMSLKDAMRQLERWYDIEVIYENNKVPDKRLAGEMTRDVPLDGLLKNLGKMGVRYKLKNRTLTIFP